MIDVAVVCSTVVGILPKEPNTEDGEATSLENKIGAAAVVVQVRWRDNTRSELGIRIRQNNSDSDPLYGKRLRINGLKSG